MMEEESIICDSDGVLEAIEDEKIKLLKTIMGDFYAVWNKVGIDEEEKTIRFNLTWESLFGLLKGIVIAEKGFYKDIKERMKNYEKKISDLSTELTIPKVQVSGTLLMKVEILRKELNKLSKQKHKRCKDFKDLRAVELIYSKILDVPLFTISSTTGVPSEADLDELEQHVNMLKNEKEHRLKKICVLKSELTAILGTTELSSETYLKKEIPRSNEDFLSLSNETFKLLRQIITKTKIKRADFEKEMGALKEELSILWVKLKIGNFEKRAFLTNHNDCRLSILKDIKGEIARGEQIKQRIIKKYTDGLKEDLSELWEKYFIAASDEKYPEYHKAKFITDALKVYDEEVSKWRQYCKDYIIQEFQNEIILDIKKYEEAGSPFLYKECNFSKFITKQRVDRIALRRRERIKQQNLRMAQRRRMLSNT